MSIMSSATNLKSDSFLVIKCCAVSVASSPLNIEGFGFGGGGAAPFTFATAPTKNPLSWLV